MTIPRGMQSYLSYRMMAPTTTTAHGRTEPTTNSESGDYGNTSRVQDLSRLPYPSYIRQWHTMASTTMAISPRLMSGETRKSMEWQSLLLNPGTPEMNWPSAESTMPSRTKASTYYWASLIQRMPGNAFTPITNHKTQREQRL